MQNKRLGFLGVAALVLVLAGAGCTESYSSSSGASSYDSESKTIEENQQRLTDAVAVPTLSTSQERENIVKRANTFDVQNKVGYIYLTSYGRVMAFYAVDGKVSSLNSFITPPDRLVDADGNPCVEHIADSYQTGLQYKPCYTVEAPDIDGAYGENDGGIFFYTTDGIYVEWKGEYLYADEALQFTSQPELVREVK